MTIFRTQHIRITQGHGLTDGNQIIVDPVWIKERKAHIGSTLQVWEKEFTVVGIYEPPGGARVKMPLSTMQEQFSSAGHATAILVGCVDPNQQETIAGRIKEKFPDDQLIMTRDLPELYATGVPALNVFLKVVIGVAAAISMLVILLAMYTTVTERTRQIGILKSLGMSKTKIAWVIEQEAIVVSFLGVVAGIIFAMGARLAIMKFTNLIVALEARWIAMAFLIGLLGTIGALYPAIRRAAGCGRSVELE